MATEFKLSYTGSEVNTKLGKIDGLVEAEERLANEIAVERARINTFTALGEGSTTGDAELVDIRTGFDGTVYSSAGEAVRSQASKILQDVTKNTEEISSIKVTANSTNLYDKSVAMDGCLVNDTPRNPLGENVKSISVGCVPVEEGKTYTITNGSKYGIGTVLCFLSLSDGVYTGVCAKKIDGSAYNIWDIGEDKVDVVLFETQRATFTILEGSGITHVIWHIVPKSNVTGNIYGSHNGIGTFADEVQMNEGVEVLPYEEYYKTECWKYEVADESLQEQMDSLEDKINASVIEVVQTTGDSEMQVMSQKAVTDALKQSEDIAAQLEKSKGITVTNMLKNSGFTGSTAPWVAYFGTMAVTDNVLTFTNNGAQPSGYVMQAVTTQADHKYYIKARARVTNADCTMLVLRDSTGSLKQISKPVQNEWYNISTIKTGLSVNVNVRHYYADSATANGKVMEIANVIVVDLTETYGSGNEPDLTSFEAMLAKFSENWFDGTVDIEYSYNIRPCINVKMYGAIGNGEVDDTQALQRAFDDGAGGTVYIPTGVYKITKSLYISSDTTIDGDGESSQLILGDGYTLDKKEWRNDNGTPKYVVVVLATRENSSNITLRNIRLTGNKTQFIEERCLGIALLDCSNCLVENCVSEYNNFNQKTQEEHVASLGQCIAIQRSNNITIRGGRYEYSGYECIGLEFATDCLIDGVYSGYGWRTSLQLHRGCKNIQIVNSVIWNDCPLYASAALTMHGGESVVDAPIDGVVISNNTIYANIDSDPTRGSCAAIVCIDDGEKNIVISNNHITTNRSGISTATTDENIIIQGNTIHTTKQGARLLAKNLLFADNIVINTCETNSQETIAIGGDSDTVIVANNIIEAENAKGINFFVGAVGGAEIRNNIIKTYAAGVYSTNRSLSKFIVSGNHVTNQSDSAIYYNQPSSDAKDTYVEIKDNVISSQSGAIYVNGNVQRPIITGNSIRLATSGITIKNGVDYALIALNDLVGATTKISAQSGENNLIVNNLGV